ncbi:MAG: tetratricopeptide repeat protein [Bacteroidia bacterium]|nr:tetratricopeptide repeat protein [Bacteroidia bacterium]
MIRQYSKILPAVFILLVTMFVAAKKLTVSGAIPEQDNKDSLLSILKNAREDTNKVNILNKLISECIKTNPDMAIVYATRALELADKLKWKKGQKKTLFTLGYIYISKYQQQKAVDCFLKAADFAREDKLYCAKCYLNAGLLYDELTEYDNALEYNQYALKIFRELNDKREIAKILGHIGINYSNKDERYEALRYYNMALEINKELGDKKQIAINIEDIAMEYQALTDFPKALDYTLQALKINEEIDNKTGMASNYGILLEIYRQLENYQKALEYGLKSLQISEQNGDNDQMAADYHNIALLYDALSNYKEAFKYVQKAVNINEVTGNKNFLARNYELMGGLSDMLGNKPEALDYYGKALNIAKNAGLTEIKSYCYNDFGLMYYHMATDTALKNPAERNELLAKSVNYNDTAIRISRSMGPNINTPSFLNSLSQTYISLGNYKKALDAYKESKNINDSIFSAENKKKIAELEAKRENEVKQKEIEILQQNNEIQELSITRQRQDMALLRGREDLQNLELEKRNNDLSIMQKDREVTILELKQKDLESEKKDKEMVLLNKEKDYQNMLSRSLTAGLVFTGIILVLLFMFFRRKRKDNLMLAGKNKLIEKSNEELLQLNQDLTEKNIEINRQKEDIEQSHSIIQLSIDQAKDYVLTLLPPKIHEGVIQADWLFLPSNQLGGDAFGYHRIDEDHYAIYILDVCGHGIGAALHSVSILHFIRSGSQLNVNPRKPELMLHSLNNTFQSDNHNGLFFTMWYGILNIRDRSLTYICAGQPAPFLIHENGNTTYLDPPSMTVGCVPDIIYKSQKIDVPGKAVLFLFSDGTYEIRKPGGKTLMVDEFYNIIRECGSGNARLQSLFDKLAGIQNSQVFEDDFSILKISLEF